MCLGIKEGKLLQSLDNVKDLNSRRKSASKINQVISSSLLTTVNNHIPISPKAPKKHTKVIKLISWSTIKKWTLT
ncbi:LOW QUALITY PROTEIN: hypothetical protein PanWU01x14_070780 [Parasponia andersonii]|uniref:Uncharacterized protein n=1 Tax=Parasponia andersonii TaxID=3476 RepID=A0A2P5DF24_PARAD|nr:LOW QUALITY PROTEIN: hypothetical protein PanWU01x14_070780 [Parasponia andersonii]